MAIVMDWDRSFPKDKPAPLQERMVYHRVCCQNSRDARDMRIFNAVGKRMQAALLEAEKNG